MENKTKESPKTKDALKQLQADMRQLQSLIAESRAEHPSEAAPSEDSAAGKKKGEVAVQFSVSLPASESGMTSFRTGPVSISLAQTEKVTDEAAALLGYALSSPQKVSLLRALLGQESDSASALGAAANLSTGSLYHHMRDLMHAGLIGQAGRNRYHITPRGQKTLMLLLALAVEIREKN